MSGVVEVGLRLKFGDGGGEGGFCQWRNAWFELFGLGCEDGAEQSLVGAGMARGVMGSFAGEGPFVRNGWVLVGVLAGSGGVGSWDGFGFRK